MHLANSHRKTSFAPVFNLVPILLALGLAGARTLPAAATDEGTPETWLAAFEAAYESGDSAAYAALLGGDFRFLFGDAENRQRTPEGFTREDELASYGRMVRGAVSAEGRVLPRASSIALTMRGVRVLPDPACPGDAGCALVHVAAATLDLRFADGSSARDTAPHAFWLERDAAGAWTCRRWVERPEEASLVPAPVVAAPAGPAAPAADEVALAGAPAWTAWPNPLRAGQSLSFVYEVAAGGADVSLRLHDVTGRARATLDRGRREGGRHLVRWDGRGDDGARLASGVYFLRARVGERVERGRVIVLP